MQVWFPGVHADVGSGYLESESGLSKIALKWMLDEAIAAGLLVNPERVERVLGNRGPPYVQPNATAAIHNSLTWKWWAAELIAKRHWDWKRGQWKRRLNLFRPRTIPPGSLIHRSASERGAEYQKRLPSDAVVID